MSVQKSFKKPLTDLEKWKSFLSTYNLGFSEKDGILNLYAQLDENVKGYQGFQVNISFDKEGSFLSFGIWE